MTIQSINFKAFSQKQEKLKLWTEIWKTRCDQHYAKYQTRRSKTETWITSNGVESQSSLQKQRQKIYINKWLGQTRSPDSVHDQN